MKRNNIQKIDYINDYHIKTLLDNTDDEDLILYGQFIRGCVGQNYRDIKGTIVIGNCEKLEQTDKKNICLKHLEFVFIRGKNKMVVRAKITQDFADFLRENYLNEILYEHTNVNTLCKKIRRICDRLKIPFLGAHKTRLHNAKVINDSQLSVGEKNKKISELGHTKQTHIRDYF